MKKKYVRNKIGECYWTETFYLLQDGYYQHWLMKNKLNYKVKPFLFSRCAKSNLQFAI